MLEELDQIYDTIRLLQRTADQFYEDLEAIGDELARTIRAEEKSLPISKALAMPKEAPSKDIHYEYGDRIKLRDLRVSEIADSLIDYHEIYTEHYGKKALFLRYEDEGTLALVLFNTNFSKIPVFLIEHL